jgi:hypothetical protein
MIEELANKDLFHKNSEVFNKYFCKNKTEKEIEKERQLSELVLSFYQKVYNKETKKVNYCLFDYDFCSYGYLEEYGYYTIDYDIHNYYRVMHYEDIHSAFIAIARKIMNKKGMQEIEQNRKQIKTDLKKRFGNKSATQLWQYEYELNKWQQYFDNEIPQELIDMYTQYVNDSYYATTERMTYTYNKESKQLISKPKILTRKLIK